MPLRVLPALLLAVLAGGLSPLTHAQSLDSTCAEGGTTLSAVEFEGLDRTDAEFLRSFLKSQAGQSYDSTHTQSDVTTLSGMEPFRTARATARPVAPDSCVVEFSIREYEARLPYVNFGGVTENFWFQVGGIDTNWLGRGYHFGVYYRYDRGHSFGLFQSMPYLFGRHWGLSYALDRLATTEPAFFGAQTVSYDVTRRSGTALLRYDLLHSLGTGRTTALEFGGGLLWERYERVASGPGPLDRRFQKYLLKARLTHRRLDYDYHEWRGVANRTKVQVIKTGGGAFNYWTVLNVFRGYLRPLPNVNWAVRLRTGLATNRRSPFVPFVLDNYINVRGIGNTVARGTAELTLNAEHRHTLATWAWGAIQGVGFADVSAWRPGGASLAALVEDENTRALGGLGIRVHLRRVYPLTLRVDYGINPLSPQQRGLVLGVGQYF
ncbi:MAG: hypothetical protein ABEL97_04460 [Salinibacter sp.]